MTEYKLHAVRFAGRVQSYVVTINGKTFVQEKNGVTIFGDGFKRTINNSWYPDFEMIADIQKWMDSLEEGKLDEETVSMQL